MSSLLRVVLAGGRVNTGGWITCRGEESPARFRRLGFLVQKPRLTTITERARQVYEYNGGPPARHASIVQELCSESRGGRPGLSVLTSLLVSVDVKNY